MLSAIAPPMFPIPIKPMFMFQLLELLKKFKEKAKK